VLEFVNIESLMSRVEADAERFASALPFPHICIDDHLRPGAAKRAADAFPPRGWEGWDNADHQYQRLKNTCSSVQAMPDPLDRVLMELNSGEVLKWLESLTGIGSILPDVKLEGGGLHTTFEGGYLVPHTDFHVTEIPHYFRRLNLLLYLNPDWDAACGGALELWSKERDVVVKEILPELGRCVIFQTDNDSVHGFSQKVRHRSQRNSVATYYYTTTSPDHFSGDGNTYWRMETLQGQAGQTVPSLVARKLFLGISRLASGVSWRAGRVAARLARDSERSGTH
jgi:Rps23 Pro-64 3,4-dihydroxylase Tpa1-like proline 4-hydroxylase